MPLPHFPRNRLLGVLATLTSVSCLALIGLGWRSLNRFEVAFAEVLREGSVYAAQEAAQQIQRDFKSPVFNLLERVDHVALKNFQLEKIAADLRDRPQQFPLIDTFFIWILSSEHERKGGAPPADQPLLLYPFSSKRVVRASPSTSEYARANGFFVDPVLSAPLEAEARKSGALRKNFALTYLTLGGRAYHVVYHFLYDEDERRVLRGAEGFMTDPEFVRQHYLDKVVAKWHRPKGQTTAVEELAVSIMDDRGREVSRSGRSLRDSYEAEVQFPFLFFDPDLLDSLSPYRPEVRYWTVRAGYEAGGAAAIARRASANQRGAWLLVGLIAVAGMASIAGASARQMRLARMQSEFVASISHDLKTPLAKIQLFAETLEAGRAKTPEKTEMYQRRISRQARKLSQLIGALLDFSKFEAGVSNYPLEELDLRALLKNTIEMFDDDLSHENATVEIVLPEGEVAVLANGEGLQQLFGNLISNAVKYSPGDRFLRIALSTVDGHAIVELTDHGIGIPVGEQRKIFRKFYRGTKAVAMAAPGSGLGLAIVDHLVRAHGGRVVVTSEPGHGSTFRVELPLVAETLEASA